jgi:hypothetical protein
LPTARAGDPLRGVAPGWFHQFGPRPAGKASAVALVATLVFLAIAGTLATTGGGILEYGGRLGAAPVVSPSAGVRRAADPSPRPRSDGAVLASVPSEPPASAAPESDSPYDCDDRAIRDETRSRWQLRAVLAGSRRGYDRVTFQLARRGNANRGGRVTLEWMSPREARDTFGIPSFDGRRGLLLTFGEQITTPGAQLIGPVDLREDRIDSISGIYRFIDVDGVARTFIALRDDSCARVRAPGLQDEGRPRSASILVDLAAP